MKASDLNNLCKIVSRISNPSSLTSLYKSIEIGGETVRSCSEFGNIAIIAEPTGLTRPVLLDTASVQAVASSLPGSAEITLEEKENRIIWKSDDAKGHWNLVQTDYSVPQIEHEKYPWVPSQDFTTALLLAATACQQAAISLGLYGVVLEPVGDKLYMMSSNTISLAKTVVELNNFPVGKTVVRPPVPAILAALLGACPNCTLDFTDKCIYIIGDWLMAQLPLGSELTHDLKKLSDSHTSCEKTAKINSASVKKFLTRAKNLTEKSSNFRVSLKIEEGKLILTHNGIASSTEQFFLAEGLPPDATYQQVDLPAEMLITPLEFVDTLVLDYLHEQKIVLKGTKPDFTYVVGGG